MNFGSHLSISGGVHKAVERGALLNLDSLQIFTKSSNQWKAKPYTEEEVSMFGRLLAEHRISPVVALLLLEIARRLLVGFVAGL